MTHELHIILVTLINDKKGVLKILSCWDSVLYLLYSFEQQRNVIIPEQGTWFSKKRHVFSNLWGCSGIQTKQQARILSNIFESFPLFWHSLSEDTVLKSIVYSQEVRFCHEAQTGYDAETEPQANGCLCRGRNNCWTLKEARVRWAEMTNKVTELFAVMYNSPLRLFNILLQLWWAAVCGWEPSLQVQGRCTQALLQDMPEESLEWGASMFWTSAFCIIKTFRQTKPC